MGAQVKLIVENSLTTLKDGYSVEVRLNWYRSLPLSSVEVLDLKLDNETVNLDLISFEINGHSYSQKELMEKYDEFWFVQDSARVHVRQPGKVKMGRSHKIELVISLRFPYMSIGPGKFLTIATPFVTTQVAHS